ncbi:hypothetical protein [Flagellimonas pacifica]|uniref:Peptidase S74 domain-containing protein n=1 Tax=Flagellimonas pacifica TaxID=1247520 RepID=A0A285MV52_9FLAO|nr:hypothetical protein [Allomuricauda parva]SNY99686.1 hypothetical protein SAMN06265377_1497 [Allomuricauda parva]
MRIFRYAVMVFLLNQSIHAQWDTTTVSNEVSTTDEIVGPVLRLSNEVRIPNAFIATDPTIGTLDNAAYGINLHKTSGIGFAFNGIHKMVFKPNGNVGIGTTNPDSKLKVIGTTTIGGKWNPGNSIFTIHDGANSIIMDTNEIYGHSTLFVGTKNGDIMRLRTVTDTGATDKVVFKGNGDVGIGTNSPQGKLHASAGTTGDAIFRLEADTDNNNESDNPLIQLRQDGGLLGVNIGYSEENFGGNIFGIGTRYSGQESWDALTINTSNGNVGIGTKNAGSWKLAIKGKIRAEEIKVETGWADYVFKENYNLPTLVEVEKHIQEKGHLINIPSAKEVKENGIQLGEMSKLLLEKIEELTLYTLQQQKQLNEKKQGLKKMEIELTQIKLIMTEQEERLQKLEQILNQNQSE